jgi:uncharacterized repeat protein (TIGR01451 family)
MHYRNSVPALLAGVASLIATGAAHAIGTAAGSTISNTASASYTVGGSPLSAISNTSTLTVAEIVNVVTTVQTPTVPVASGDANRAMVFRVTNTGNGPEKFSLAAISNLVGDQFDPVLATPAIYFDTDNSGTLTAADIAYVPGGNDPQLAPDAAVTILVINSIPAALTNGNAGLTQLTATSFTPPGPAGTVRAGLGVGGTDAIIGNSTGVASDRGSYVIADVQVLITKTQTIVDPFGGNRPVPGASVTYQLVVTTTGSGTATSVVIADPIPVNTSFVPGSLLLNGAAQTDATDGDAGHFSATPSPGVSFSLGNLTSAGGPQTIRFGVTIN